jgi:glutathione S-transferase
MTIKIYGLPHFTGNARVLTTFAEKNEDDYEIVPVDFSVGTRKSPEFLKLQVRRVPASLVPGKTIYFPILFESSVILYRFRKNPRDQFSDDGSTSASQVI